MKLSLAVLATVVQCAPEKSKQRKPTDERFTYTNVYTPLQPCSAPVVKPGQTIFNEDEQTVTFIKGGSPFTSVDNGTNGQVTIDDYVGAAYCYVSLGPNCDNGVEVEIVYMAVTNWVNDDVDPYEYDGCIDRIHFSWLSKDGSTEEQTDPQCGCLDNESHPTCNDPDVDDYFMDYYGLKPTEKPTKYNLTGTDVKLVLDSGNSYPGGKIQVDWKCIPSTETVQITNTLEMAQAVLTGDFTPEMAADYGCSGRGLFDPFSRTIGSHADLTDAAFFKWKKCVQCASDNNKSNILPYSYDALNDSCGKYNFIRSLIA